MTEHIIPLLKNKKRVRLSFSKLTEELEKSLGIEYINESDRALFKELCFIICEMLLKDPESVIKIDGEDISAGRVSEIYLMLERYNLECVMERYKKITYDVHRRKSYLRSALYNSVFESESGLINDVNSNY